MQKIGLLSYQFWYNYGTCLQAYALWKTIQKLGFDSEYIDFGWQYPQYPENKSILTLLKKILKKLLLKNDTESKILFDRFRKEYIKESEPVDIKKLSDIEADYRTFIVGSDQTWNPDCVEELYFKVFLLSFVKDNRKKCAYAPSIGRNFIDEHCKELYKKYLSDFHFISCRETSGCKILSEVLEKNISQVLDPTLLLTSADWNSVAHSPTADKDYILCYILGEKKSICDFAKKIALSQGKQLYILAGNFKICRQYKKYVLSGVGPSEFVGLIKHCSCLITDSFHGTIFSINFNKDFYAFYKRVGGASESDNSRMLDTLRQFGLEKRLRQDNDQELGTRIDYSCVNLTVDDYRKSSVKFLKKILEVQFIRT